MPDSSAWHAINAFNLFLAPPRCYLIDTIELVANHGAVKIGNRHKLAVQIKSDAIVSPYR